MTEMDRRTFLGTGVAAGTLLSLGGCAPRGDDSPLGTGGSADETSAGRAGLRAR